MDETVLGVENIGHILGTILPCLEQLNGIGVLSGGGGLMADPANPLERQVDSIVREMWKFNNTYQFHDGEKWKAVWCLW